MTKPAGHQDKVDEKMNNMETNVDELQHYQ